jgi:hypothetical protein
MTARGRTFSFSLRILNDTGSTESRACQNPSVCWESCKKFNLVCITWSLAGFGGEFCFDTQRIFMVHVKR